MNSLTEETLRACRIFGAYSVREAALRHQNGDSEALKEIGMNDYGEDYRKVLDISNIAFSQMTDAEKFNDFETHFQNKSRCCKNG